MTADVANPGPSRSEPTFKRPEWAHDDAQGPILTHGEACPIWMWLSGGYVKSAFERSPSREKTYDSRANTGAHHR